MSFLVLVLACLGQTTIKDGSWHDPAVWSAPLTRDSDVVIKHKVTIEQSVAVRTIEVAAEGSLELSGNSGRLEVVFTDSPIDTAADPEQYTHGLIVRGKLRINGQPKTPFVRINDLAAGKQTAFLEAHVDNWAAGDLIYLADTRQPANQFNPATYPLESDYLPLESIDALKVTLAKPTAYAHRGAYDFDGRRVFSPVAANLSRSITLRSENPAGVRAHAIFLDRADVVIRNAAFLDMGRTTGAKLDSTVIDAAGKILKVGTNQIGRYPLHFHHHMGPEKSQLPNFEISGSVVWSKTPAARWGITIHQAHFGLIKDNVVVCCAGAGIVTEDGNETQNTFEGNYVSHVTGEGRPDARANEVGFEGSAYWFRGGDNIVRDNLAANAKDGFVYYARFAKKFKRPTTPGATPTVETDPVKMPLRAFERNETLGCQVGFAAWWVGVNNRTPIEQMPRSLVKDLHCWHTRQAVGNYECSNFTWQDFVAIGDKTKMKDANGGWGGSDYVQHKAVIDGARIENFNAGIRVGSICDRVDATGTNPGLFVIRNCRIRANSSIIVPIPWHNATAHGLPPLTVHIDNLDIDPLPAQTDRRHFVLGGRVSEFSNYAAWSNVWYRHGAFPLSLRLFGENQYASAIIPATSADGRIQGAPEKMTNADAWSLYGVAGGGELAPAVLMHDLAIVGGATLASGGPYVRPIPDCQVIPGEKFAYGVCAYDPSFGELDYTIEGPAGIAIENRSGRINWPTPIEGKHAVTVRARDVDTGATASQTFMINVRMPAG